MDYPETRVRLIGSLSARLRALQRCLRDAGMTVESSRSSAIGALDLRRVHADVLILLVDAANERADLEQLQSWRQKSPAFPIIAVAPMEKAAACLDAGADDCVLPSIEAAELAARIRAHLRRGTTRPKVVRIFDLEIDAQKRSVIRSGSPIHLTPREFAILDMLAAHRGRVVTRVMIWQRLYNEAERYASNVVDVYIRYLRQKIDKDFSPPLIQTAWGRGYMLRNDDDDSTAES